jgi:hypothetical protein
VFASLDGPLPKAGTDLGRDGEPIATMDIRECTMILPGDAFGEDFAWNRLETMEIIARWDGNEVGKELG